MLRLDDIEIGQADWTLGADLLFARDSATALIGPSGEGKSSLLLAIAGFLELRRGRITWDGRDITDLPPAARPVTLMFQEHNLFAQMTAARNVALGLSPALRLDRAGWARVEAALATVGLGGLGARRPSELSGGQRQRVALARALLRDKPVLLLDEPFAALGPALRAGMLDLVARLRAETRATLLLVTHHPEDARRITPETVVVAEGIAQPPQPTRMLLEAPPPALAAYLGRP